MAPSIWFMSVSVNGPSGGINNIYRLCELAEELGIHARVVGPSPYGFADPPHLSKYWQHAENHVDVSEGDIVVGPEIWPTKSMFGVPVRRVIYIQNWSVAHPRLPWERTFWYYGGVHHNYAIGRCGAEVVGANYFINPYGQLELEQAAPIVNAQKVEWFRVQPYFNFNKFNPNNDNRMRNTAVAMPRRCPHLIKILESCVPLAKIDGVHPSDVGEYLRRYGVFVLLTPAEGLCFPAIEALASGTAVVAWPSGAPEEYLIDGETARMVPYGNLDRIIEVTNELLADHKQQKRLAERGRELVTAVFTREQSKAQLYMAYHAVCRQDPIL